MNVPRTTVRLLTALLKHQARVWLGDEAADILSDTFIDEEVRRRLDAWARSGETQKRLLDAAEQARAWLQDPANCPDPALRELFHDLDFGTLPSVQEELARLPMALDLRGLETALRRAFDRDLPRMDAAKRAEAARLYAEALLRAVSTLKPFAQSATRLLLFDVYAEVRRRGEEHEHILAVLAELKALLQRWVREGVVTLPTPDTLPGDLPPGSRLPFPRNALFTGREAQLAQLAQALAEDVAKDFAKDFRGLEDLGSLPPRSLPAVLITQAVTGMGGVGKTQLAVEFAYRYGYRFKGVHWLDLRDPALFEEQVAACGEAMGLPRVEGEDLPAYVGRVLATWKAEGPRLLILDNLEDPAAAREILPRLHHHNLRLLLTARRHRWPKDLGLNPLPLETFTPEEARDFLRRYLPPERATDADLDALAERLGYLPLALELAGRYLHALAALSVADYLARLEDVFAHRSMQNWRPEEGSPTAHDLNLWATFHLSWERVSNPDARRLFLACGYLAPNTPIPAAILRLVVEDEEALAEALDDLSNLGLLTPPPEPTVHPLLAEFARDLARSEDAPPDWDAAAFLESLADLAVRTNREVDRTGDYSLYAPLVPHVRATAEIAGADGPAPSVGTDGYPSFKEAAARLWNSLGYHLHDVADYTGARDAYERALRIDKAVFGPDHPNVARDVNNLGGVLQALGDLEGARAAFERALRIDKAVFGPDHPNVATDVNNLGSVLQDLGDLEGARAAFERALRIDEAVFGPDHPNVARDVNNLGSVLQDLGDLQGARAAFERALRILEKRLPPDHPHIRIVRGNLEKVS